MNVDLDRGCHISFDLWLTLIRSHEQFKPNRNQLLVDHFGICQPRQVVDETILRFDRAFNAINQIVGRNLDAYELFLIVLHDLGCDINTISQKQMNAFYADIEALFWKYTPVLLEPEMVNVLQKLQKQGYTFSILSNTGFVKGYLLRKMLNTYFGENLFSFQLYSDEIGASKPSPVFYQEMIKNVEKLGKKTSEIIHVGDSQIADYDGAKSMGLKAYLFDYKKEKISTMLSEHA